MVIKFWPDARTPKINPQKVFNNRRKNTVYIDQTYSTIVMYKYLISSAMPAQSIIETNKEVKSAQTCEIL